eukprot:COSAG01_NODE_857_length_13073_cov_13.630415_8_plen_83_part_00
MSPNEGERITALVHLTGDEIAAVNAYKRAASEDESGKASTASDADWLRSTIRPPYHHTPAASNRLDHAATCAWFDVRAGTLE